MSAAKTSPPSNGNPEQIVLGWFGSLNSDVLHKYLPVQLGYAYHLDPEEPNERVELEAKTARFLAVINPSVGEQVEVATPMEIRDFGRLLVGRATEEYTQYRTTHFDQLTGARTEIGQAAVIDRWRRARLSGQVPPNKRKVGCAYLDLTNFKRINDVLGHAVGNQVLIEMFDQSGELARRADQVVLVRTSGAGDEFLLLAGSITGDHFDHFIERLKANEFQKVDKQKQIALWDKIMDLYSRAESNKRKLDVQIVDRYEPRTEIDGKRNIPYRRYLTIDGEEIAPLRDLMVASIGSAYGSIMTDKEVSNLIQDAEHTMWRHKRVLQLQMGQYRESSQQ
jgi:GGDEF domain-containing protein